MRIRRAFTMMEIMVVVVIAAILFVSSMPDSDTANQEGLRQFSEKIEADLDYARSLSIADPGDPMVLKVDPDGNRYWLAKQSAPDLPIADPSSKKPYIVNCGVGGMPSLKRVKIIATDFGADHCLKFDSTGSINLLGTGTLRVQAGDDVADIHIAPNSAEATISPELNKTLEVYGKGNLSVAPVLK